MLYASTPTLHLTIHLFPSSPPLRPAEGDEALRRPGGALDAAVLIDQALAEEGLSAILRARAQFWIRCGWCFLLVAGQIEGKLHRTVPLHHTILQQIGYVESLLQPQNKCRTLLFHLVGGCYSYIYPKNHREDRRYPMEPTAPWAPAHPTERGLSPIHVWDWS